MTTLEIPIRRVLRTWWPLAASWILMALELPALSAVVARLPQAEINLAAWGGVVFPLALLIEAPIIMLLAASTTLSRDWESFARLRRYMMWMGAALTALHIVVAFTHLYDIVVIRWIGVPSEIVEPARLGMQLMTPWTWSIAYRRFHQGVLIRFDHSRAVGVGTLIRLGADVSVLIFGLLTGLLPGIAVAGLAVSAGVMSEALYAGLRTRPVLRDQVRRAPPVDESITMRSFLAFYIPLAMTSLLFLLTQPIGSAAMSRMPAALNSLAVWPVVSGLVFLLRSLGMAYNEVVVALLDEPGAVRTLQRFTLRLSVAVTAMLVIIAVTPISRAWFERISALNPSLAELGRTALWFAFPLPALNVIQSWFQGVILSSRRTRAITEAVIAALVVIMIVLGIGVAVGRWKGVYVGWTAFSLGAAAQVAWLWVRSRSRLQALTT